MNGKTTFIVHYHDNTGATYCNLFSANTADVNIPERIISYLATVEGLRDVVIDSMCSDSAIKI
jgi:hypothetical protein